MTTKLNVATVWVLDKEEALDFYVNKLGLEKGSDVKQGPYRWLTVRSRATRGRDLTRGARAADPRRSHREPAPRADHQGSDGRPRPPDGRRAGLYETLKARGVTDFTQEPTDHFYGTDMGIRDPFGNGIRILQPAKAPRRNGLTASSDKGERND